MTAAAQQTPTIERGNPGSQAGTEQWLVLLKNRGFSLSQALQAIRSQSTVANRQAQMAVLRQAVLSDQSPIAQMVTAAGGVVEQHYWVLSALAVQVPPAALPLLRAHPRVDRLVPVRAYKVADVDRAPAHSSPAPVAPPVPIQTSTDALNHNASGAWAILGGGATPYRGAGARIAVFDTGIDADVLDQRITGQTNPPDPHPAFRIGTTTSSRIEVHLQAQAVNTTTRHADVNICDVLGPSPFVSLTPPFGWRLSRHHGHAGHGTAMAGIIAGTTFTASPQNVGNGHAPDASLIDVACSSYTVSNAGFRWEFTDAGMLGGIQALRDYILQSSNLGPVHVLNLSVSGDPSPDALVTRALDSLARDEDILLVTSAGNDADTTTASFGFYHGLAVGAVHARSATDNSSFPPKPGYLAFLPMPESSRGPLASDHRRLFPDVCATGAGPGSLESLGGGLAYARRFRYPGSFADTQAQGTCLFMPGIDTLDLAASTAGNSTVSVSPVRWNRGTSEAAAQVSGAAALYRGFRASQATPASAEETRAAILLNVLGTYATYDAQGTLISDTSLQHTFSNRNTFGVGYVRDDLLAQFAVRNPLIVPLAQVVTLDSTTPVASVSYGPVVAGKRYAAVACWRRYADFLSDAVPAPELELPNVDLEVVANGVVVARSATPANSYERLAFVAAASGSVTLRVRIVGVPRTDQVVSVQIVAREFAPFIDPATPALDQPIHAATGQAETISAGSACTATAQAWNVARIVPQAYGNAYGSAPFQFVPNSTINPVWYTHAGYARGFNFGVASWIRIDLAQAQVGGQIQIDGLAFRASTPVNPNTDVQVTVYLQDGGPIVPSSPPPTASGTFSVGGTLRRVAASAGDLSLDSFPVQILFPTPFLYSGTTTLHIWVAAPQNFSVEGTDDGFGNGYDSYYTIGPALVSNLGAAPIIGLLAKSAAAPREVRLETFGEPWCSNGTLQREFMWRLTGPANSVYAVELGFMAGSGQGAPCSYWLTNSFLITGFPFPSTDAVFGRAQGYVTMPAQLVGADLGLQATILSPAVRSNAVRLTVGGGL